jgi:putative tricarboxylic transport membrane protein
MDTFNLLINGFFIAFQPLNLALVIFGCTVGLFIGAMPGLGSVNGVAILLPMTFLVPPTSAVIFLAAIYYGAMYGGAISSIMLGIPGASTAVATTFDGRPLALQGLADRALIAAATASFVGGTISVVLFTLFAPPLAEMALAFGAPEEFALMMLAFATFVGLGTEDISKTLFSIFIGLVLSAVGLDIISGQPRLIFGDIPGFFHGINFLVLAIGIYGIGEILWTVETSKGEMKLSKASISYRRIIDGLKALKGTIKTMIMGSFLGYFVGILPAAGATPGSLMAYGAAKTMAKDPETFGKGNLNGVVAPESANNAASTGSMLPMLTYAANLFALLINIAFIPVFIWVLKMPFTILAPIIYILCVVGGYAPTKDMHDVWLMLIFGVVAYLMRKLDYPMAPAVLALVLGPLAETSMRQSLLISNGSFSIFFMRPIAGTISSIAIVLFILPLWTTIKNLISRRVSDSQA